MRKQIKLAYNRKNNASSNYSFNTTIEEQQHFVLFVFCGRDAEKKGDVPLAYDHTKNPTYQLNLACYLHNYHPYRSNQSSTTVNGIGKQCMRAHSSV